MSLPLQQLLGMLNQKAGNVPAAEGTLYNPSIPDPPKSDKIQSRKIIKDKYMHNMKLANAPRGSSGNYFRLAKGLTDPRLDSFGLEGSIDPNTIRRKVDPDAAIPNLHFYGSEGALYELPEGALKATNGVGLLKKARSSFYNYKNRFALPNTSPSEGNEITA